MSMSASERGLSGVLTIALLPSAFCHHLASPGLRSLVWCPVRSLSHPTWVIQQVSLGLRLLVFWMHILLPIVDAETLSPSLR